jgi:hypothetical protein
MASVHSPWGRSRLEKLQDYTSWHRWWGLDWSGGTANEQVNYKKDKQ